MRFKYSLVATSDDGSTEVDIGNLEAKVRRAVLVKHLIGILFAILSILASLFLFRHFHDRGPADYYARAHWLLGKSPVIDGHVDLPILAREVYKNQLSDINLYKPLKGHVDIPRLREGRSGGFFWSVYADCPEDDDFLLPSFRVRDTLEQIDIAKLLIERHQDTFALVRTASEWEKALSVGKMGGMIGVEGAHQLGNSISSIRIFYELGARYLSLTHNCNNFLADAAGTGTGPAPVLHDGLSDFGKDAVHEMNRLGMMVDGSHSSAKSTSDAFTYSLAPVIFSHSNAYGVHPHLRNVVDGTLKRIGKFATGHVWSLAERKRLREEAIHAINEEDKPIPGGDAIVMLNFLPDFIGPKPVNVSSMADHADYIGKLAGRAHVGIGSDFDGMLEVPEGLEDTSKYPNLLAELIRRGWTDEEVRGVASGNILRVLKKVELVATQLKGDVPFTGIYRDRTDM